MIRVEWKSRFANQLFQYCFGRILHLKTGREVQFPATFYRDKSHQIPYTKLWKPESLIGKPSPSTDFLLVEGHAFDSSLLDCGRPLLLRGWFQRYEYYRPYKEQIKNWLPLPTPNPTKAHPDDLYLHIRRTDYLFPHTKNYQTIPATWREHFDKAIERFPEKRKVFIVTDDPKDEFLDYFIHKYDAQVTGGSMTMDFLTLAAANKVILSESTFGWWATFLGKAEKVVCPLRADSIWNREFVPSTDLIIADEQRFEFIR